MFDQTDIIPKMKDNRIREVKLLNMKEPEIQDLNFLTNSERMTVSRKIKEYSLKTSLAIKYSAEIRRFFLKKKKEKILNKMKEKRVTEKKLLNLVPKEIREMSFLNFDEKDSLPQLLKEFVNEKEFSDINKLIKENTSSTKK